MNLPITIQALNPEIPLRKHSATIHVESSLSLVDRKLLNILYKCANDNDVASSEYFYVKFNDVANYCGWKKFVMQEIKDSLSALRVSKIEWNIFGQDNKNKSQWIAAGESGFIGSFLIMEEFSAIRFSLSPEIKAIISNPSIYTYIDIRVQKLLKSKYDMILYEMLLDEINHSKKNECISRLFSIADLRRLFSLPPDAYPVLKEFKRALITLPLERINKTTHLDVSVVGEESVKRNIIALRFKIAYKENMMKDIEPIQTELDFDEYNNITENQYDFVAELLSLGLDKKTCDRLIETVNSKYPDCSCDDLIKANIKYAKRHHESGGTKILNFHGLLIRAIENDYAKYANIVKEQAAKEYTRSVNTILSEKKKLEDAKKDAFHIFMRNEFINMPNEEKRKYFDKLEAFAIYYKNIPDDDEDKINMVIGFYQQLKEKENDQ